MTYRLINSTNIDIDIHLCFTNSLQQQIATAKVGDSFDDDTVDNLSEVVQTVPAICAAKVLCKKW